MRHYFFGATLLLSAASLGACGELAGLGSPPVVTTVDASTPPPDATTSGDASDAGPRRDVSAVPEASMAADTADGAVDFEGGGSSDGEAGLDGAADADAALPIPVPPSVTCDAAAPFGAPVLVDSLNTPSSNNYDARLTIDELTLYLASDRDTTLGGLNLRIYVATREHFTDPFGTPQRLGGINDGTPEESQFAPSVTEDGLSLFLNISSGTIDVFTATRTDPQASFGAPAIVANLYGGGILSRSNPMVTPDGTALYLYSSSEPNAPDELYLSQRGAGGQFSPLAPISELDDGGDGINVAINADQTTIVFASTRQPNYGQQDIWMSSREATSVPWQTPTNLAAVNTFSTDDPTWISGDGCRLYLQSDVSGYYQIYLASRP